MIWEEEAFEFDKEKHMKKYIKGELMSYYQKGSVAKMVSNIKQP